MKLITTSLLGAIISTGALANTCSPQINLMHEKFQANFNDETLQIEEHYVTRNKFVFNVAGFPGELVANFNVKNMTSAAFVKECRAHTDKHDITKVKCDKDSKDFGLSVKGTYTPDKANKTSGILTYSIENSELTAIERKEFHGKYIEYPMSKNTTLQQKAHISMGEPLVAESSNKDWKDRYTFTLTDSCKTSN